MARTIGAACRICRREGMKLYLKGTRCDTPKCAIARRERPPGEHPFTRGKPSSYAIQLREKQRVKRYYGVLERQFRKIFAEVARAPGNTGENLLIALERRLDNVVYRSGLVVSRNQARQWIAHGNILVNDHRVDIPSYRVKANDVITVAPDEKVVKLTRENLEITKGRTVPAWLEVSEEPIRVRAISMPTRTDVSIPIQEQLIVELLSK